MTKQHAATSKPTIWSHARDMALKAPPERNRYVDFLRAFSILAVVVGHWLVAAPYIENGAVKGGHLLGILPGTQWLTWGFQVMPIFFLVGGFSTLCRGSRTGVVAVLIRAGFRRGCSG